MSRLKRLAIVAVALIAAAVQWSAMSDVAEGAAKRPSLMFFAVH